MKFAPALKSAWIAADAERVQASFSTIDASARDAGSSGAAAAQPGLPPAPGSIASLVADVPVFTPRHSCAHALECFASCAHEALPVVDADRPLGLIVRSTFIERFARPFHHELFDHKSCTVFMDRSPLIAERDTSLSQIGNVVASTARKALQDGMIVTRRGSYAGIITGQALVRALADAQLARSEQIIESMRYASRIQRALLHTSNEELNRWLPKHRLFWEPRDVVGGDYYFCRGTEARTLLVVLDCTGHGVPGALMTMIMTASLEAAAKDVPSLHPGEILINVNRRVRHALGQHASSGDFVHFSAESPNDGMDAAAVLIDREAGCLLFSGARLPLFVLYPGAPAWVCMPHGRLGVGYIDTPDDAEWPVSKVPLQVDMRLCIATDGIFDQIGGPTAIAFGKARFARALGNAAGCSLTDQFENALREYRAWQGLHSRRDDATMTMIEV